MRALSATVGLVCALASAIGGGLVVPIDSGAAAIPAVLAFLVGVTGFAFAEWMRGAEDAVPSDRR